MSLSFIAAAAAAMNCGSTVVCAVLQKLPDKSGKFHYINDTPGTRANSPGVEGEVSGVSRLNPVLPSLSLPSILPPR